MRCGSDFSFCLPWLCIVGLLFERAADTEVHQLLPVLPCVQEHFFLQGSTVTLTGEREKLFTKNGHQTGLVLNVFQ